MADISAEIAAFQNAAYGEDVRSALVSLARKLNNGVEFENERQVRVYVERGGYIVSRYDQGYGTNAYLTWGSDSTNRTLVILDGINNTSNVVAISDVQNATMQTINDIDYLVIPIGQRLIYNTTTQQLYIENRTNRIPSNKVVLWENGHGVLTSATKSFFTRSIDGTTLPYVYLHEDAVIFTTIAYDDNNLPKGYYLYGFASQNNTVKTKFNVVTKRGYMPVDFADALDSVIVNNTSVFFLPVGYSLMWDIAAKKMICTNSISMDDPRFLILLTASAVSHASGTLLPTFKGLLAPYIHPYNLDDWFAYLTNGGVLSIIRRSNGSYGIYLYFHENNNITPAAFNLINKKVNITRTISLLNRSNMTYENINGLDYLIVPEGRQLYYNPIEDKLVLYNRARPGSIGELMLFGTAPSAVMGILVDAANRDNIRKAEPWMYVTNGGTVEIIKQNDGSVLVRPYTHVADRPNITMDDALSFQTRTIGVNVWNDLSDNLIVKDGIEYLQIDAHKILYYHPACQKCIITDRNMRYIPTDAVVLLITGYGTIAGGLLAENAAINETYREDDSLLTSNTRSKFCNIISNSIATESFIFLTDVHSHRYFTDFFSTSLGFHLIKQYSRTLPIDFVLNGGDWLDNTLDNTTCPPYLSFISGMFNQTFKKSYLIAGNHDFAYQYKDGPDGEPNTGLLDAQLVKNVYLPYQDNLYYQFDGRNTHFYIFNSYLDWGATSLNDITRPQIPWFANNLLNDSSNHIAIGIHIWWYYYSSDEDLDDPTTWIRSALANELRLIINAFNTRSTYTFDGQTYNYSSKSGRIEFVISGHTHRDLSEICPSGVPVISTTDFKSKSGHEFDLVHADYDRRRLFLVRVGTGNDRTYNLDTGELITE